jgi:quercetin dioxygenase-like cupin family protein
VLKLARHKTRILAEGPTMAELIKDGAMQLRFLRTKYDTSGALDMFEVVIPPNSRMPVPHHHRGREETIYGLEGVVTWTVAGKRIEIKSGDDIFIPRGVVHGFVNETQAIAKMLLRSHARRSRAGILPGNGRSHRRPRAS